MLPSYHHGGSMPGHGSKPLRRPWVPDLSGTLIAVLVLAVVLALEHFHFQSRLSRVSSLEVSLANQLHDLQTSLQQQTDQLKMINPRMVEIDSAESSLKRLQEEVVNGKKDLLDAKAAVEDKFASANKQIDNVTNLLTEASARHSRDLEALTKQLDSLRDWQNAQVANNTVKDLRISLLESNVSKLAAKLDSHNSALKTLADQLALHQNSTLSALQEQTAAVSEALEAHRELKDRVESLKRASGTGGTAGSAADEEEKVVAAVKKGIAAGKEVTADNGLQVKASEEADAGQSKASVEALEAVEEDKDEVVSSKDTTDAASASKTGRVSTSTTAAATTTVDKSSTDAATTTVDKSATDAAATTVDKSSTAAVNTAEDASAASDAKPTPTQSLGKTASTASGVGAADGAGVSNGESVAAEEDHMLRKRSSLAMDDGDNSNSNTAQDSTARSSSDYLAKVVASPTANSTTPSQELSQLANVTAAPAAQTGTALEAAAANQTTPSKATAVTDSVANATSTTSAPALAATSANATVTNTFAKTAKGAVDSATALNTLHALISPNTAGSDGNTAAQDSNVGVASTSNSIAAELAAESALKALSRAAEVGAGHSDVQDAGDGVGTADNRHGRMQHLFTKKHLEVLKSGVLEKGATVMGAGAGEAAESGEAGSGTHEDAVGLKAGLTVMRGGAGEEEVDTATAPQEAAGGDAKGKQAAEELVDEEEQDVVE